MTKNEFKLKLYEELEGVSVNEKSRILDYFDELISDAVDDGQDEEIFINGLGDIKAIVNKVKAEQRIKYAKENPGISSGAKAVIAVLSLCALPLALPLGLALVGIVISIVAAVIGVVFSIIGGGIGLIFGGIGLGIGGIITVIASVIRFPFAIASNVINIGGVFISIGISILVIVILIKFAKVFLKIIGNILNAIVDRIYHKRGN